MIKDWIEIFHRDGAIVIPNAINLETCNKLKEDLDAINLSTGKPGLKKRMFEHSDANLQLFWNEPIVSFAEQLIADDGGDNSFPPIKEAHVIHNNSFIIKAGKDGLGKSSWHMDDSNHFLSLDGKPANIRLNVLAITCLYYLTDVLTIENGPTQYIPGSHLFGIPCTDDNAKKHEDKAIAGLGAAGTCVIVNNQVWHKGSKNTSKVNRYVTQISYAKRFVGHKYQPFVGYTMPEHIYKDIKDPRKLRLLGFLSSGPYG